MTTDQVNAMASHPDFSVKHATLMCLQLSLLPLHARKEKRTRLTVNRHLQGLLSWF